MKNETQGDITFSVARGVHHDHEHGTGSISRLSTSGGIATDGRDNGHLGIR